MSREKSVWTCSTAGAVHAGQIGERAVLKETVRAGKVHTLRASTMSHLIHAAKVQREAEAAGARYVGERFAPDKGLVLDDRRVPAIAL